LYGKNWQQFVAVTTALDRYFKNLQLFCRWSKLLEQTA
jgi:hypothetical protein